MVGFSILALKVGDFVLTYTNERYAVRKKIKTWNSRMAELEQEDHTERQNNDCQLKFSLPEDTLAFKKVHFKEKHEGYGAEFKYFIFDENNAGIRLLNQEVELLVFDGFSDSKKYFSNFLKAYKAQFKGAKEEKKYNWQDWEKIELIINSNQIVSAIHYDLELKSGGAIWFGDRIGFNFDLERMKKITFDDLIDSSKLSVLYSALIEAYKEEFGVNSLKAYGWDKEKIPISENFYLGLKGITFIYQRFEHNGVGGNGLNIQIPYCELKDALRADSPLMGKLK